MCAFATFCCASDVSKVSVLVPGAGLGRLAWEIARLGYMCQGNEWSFFMLFSSNFVLNRYGTGFSSYTRVCASSVRRGAAWRGADTPANAASSLQKMIPGL